MEGQMFEKRRFNWKLGVVLVLGAAVLAATVYKLHQWRTVQTAEAAVVAGKAAYEAKQWRKAAIELGRYVGLHPAAVPELLMYAEAQLRTQPQKENNVNQALNAYLQALRADPSNTTAADKVSQLYLEMRMPNDAIVILERRLAFADDARARQIYAMALVAAGRYRDAAQEFQKVIEAAPTEVSAYQRLAELARMRPEELPTSPLEILRTAVAKNPSSAAARIALGAYLARWAGQKDAAAREFETAKTLDLSDANTRVSLAARLIEIGDQQGASEQLDLAGRQDPRLAALWFTWAALVRVAEARQDAAEVAEAAMATLGEEAYPFLSTAVELFIFAGKTDKAKETLEKMRKADDQNPDIAYLDGAIAQGEGDLAGAIAIWRRAAEAAESLRVRLALADAYRASGDAAAALRELRALASRYGDVGAARLALAKALGQAGEWREAAGHSQAAVQMSPQDLEARALDISIRAHAAAMDGAGAGTWRKINEDVADLRARAGDSAMALLLAADVAQLQKNMQTPLEIAMALGAKQDTRAQGLLLENETLWRSNRRAEALDSARRTVSEFPGNPAAVAQLSDMLMRSGDAAGALAALDEGIRNTSDREQRDLRRAKAIACVRSGDRKQASEILAAVAAEYPGDIASRVALIDLIGLADRARVQRIINEIRTAEGGDGFRWKYQQARLWLFSDEWKARLTEAADLLRANVKSDPRDVASRLLLGVAEERAGRLSLALEAYRQAYAQAPDSAQAVFYLVSALQKNGNLEEAGSVLDEAARRGLGGERLASLKLGQQLREGETGSAIETVEEMLSGDPGNANLKLFLAGLKMRQNDLEGARAVIAGLDGSDPNAAMANAELLMREGRKDEAVAVATSIVDATGTAAARLFRARLYVLSGNADAAEADYREIARIEPRKAQSWMLLSDFLFIRNRAGEAAEAISRAVEIDPKNPDVVMRAVRLYSASPDAKVRASADRLLTDAMKSDSDNADLVLFQAQRLMTKGTLDALREARSLLDALSAKRPDMPQVWAMAARAALLEGKSDSALEAISKGLAAQGDDAQRRLLMLLKADAERLRWPALAEATLRGLWDKDNTDASVGLLLASMHVEAGEARKALAVIEQLRATAQGRDALTLDLLAADALSAGGDWSAAVERARSAGASAPDDVRPMVALVRLLAKADRVEEAIAVMDAWQAAHPQDLAATVMAGQALLAAGTPPARPDTAAEQKSRRIRDAAVAVFTRAVTAYPDNYRLKLALAQALQVGGYTPQAARVYREVLAVAPEDAIAVNNLAWLLAQEEGGLAEALLLVDKCRKKNPDFAELRDTGGVILQRLGRLAEAEDELREALRLSRVNSASISSARYHLGALLAARGSTDEAMKLVNEALSGTGAARLGQDDRAKAEALLSELTAGAAGGQGS